MAAKRYFEGDGDQDDDQRTKTRPSFASVIREVVMVNFFENFCSALEPMLRRVVSEEVENGVRRGGCMVQYPALRLGGAAPAPAPARLQLAFTKRLSLPIFTGTKIVDADANPLRIILVDHETQTKVPALPYPHAIKLEIVVLDGDFPAETAWTSRDFASSIVKERAGKRPLLAGDMSITMRADEGVVTDIEFTDNSSWIRSRKFRIGARVQLTDQAAGGVREAITEPFVVKDHRGELYKKNHPPALHDQVWRLQKIGKGGAFHQKLAVEGIHTVQDFLKLFHVDSTRLKKILGIGMSEKMWEATVKHAKECVVDSKLYRFHADTYTLTLNPVCQLLRLRFTNGQDFTQSDFPAMQTGYIENLVKEAYSKWDSLEIVDGPPLDTTHSHSLLLTQPDDEQQVIEPQHRSIVPIHRRHSHPQQQQQLMITRPLSLADDHSLSCGSSIIEQTSNNNFVFDGMDKWSTLNSNSNSSTAAVFCQISPNNKSTTN